jgi:hypothetical protein
MKTLRFTLFALLISFAAAVFAQTKQPDATQKSDAQKSFEKLKALAGTWEGPFTIDVDAKEHEKHHEHGKGDDVAQISLRVTSRGNALVHEMKGAGQPDDPAKYDHPVTMFYIDADKLMLVHYCDAGNRPRMTARVSEDGNKVEFDYLDLSGSNKFGHMYHAVFTIIDADHHIEDWTYMMPGDKPVHAHAELHRVKQQEASLR